ncbi:MAG TPA: type II toxin-antitoxin system ParD family antitoxin [Candidatus Acidoferrales bacterium]|nr:type II toxin-antitoxin system ParD family antitoxin [Candidatus Acidoferrales bacterium]
MRITLNKESEKFVSDQVSSGRYRSADDVVQHGLALLQEREKDSPSPPSNGDVNLLENVQRLANGVSEKDWDSIPSDLAKNVDHYLYGTRKNP